MNYQANSARYESMSYKRSGKSGVLLPAVSLGLWKNFGGEVPLEQSRKMVLRALDLGITHFDMANNDGPPYDFNQGNIRSYLEEGFAPLSG